MMRTQNKWLITLALTVIVSFVLLGCGLLPGGNKITVLAGSELKDLEPLFDQIRKATGITLEMNYIGTLDGAEKLIAGEDYDLAWFSHAKYLTLLQDASGRISAQEKIMLSPVILGVKESKAQSWGWVNNPDLTWRDVVTKASSGELRYGMTNPTSSNTGFTTLVGVASALTGSADALKAEDIAAVSPDLKAFFKGQALTSGSSGWLAESYVREQDRLDGLINYESVLLGMNKSGELKEKLVLIYPKEGIITADYPLMLINKDKREAYDKLVAFLRSPDFQKTIMEQTLRRPVIPQVPLSSDFSSQLLIELPFPNSIEVIDQLLFSYLDEQRIPAHAFFVLDTSGSMSGDGIRDLKTALDNLTGADTSLTGQFARFRNRERVTMLPFSNSVQEVRNFEIGIDDQSTLLEVRSYVNGLDANGGTAIFDALRRAYELVLQAQQQDPDRYYSIVLMSDGKNTDGISQHEFVSYYRSLGENAKQIKTFTILFGQAEKSAMETIANETGGRMFDAKSESLSLIFKQIRGYQ
ncbi:MAG: VWA domain-containing protein [Anaerolineae bacterium]|nr:VWA domain-containing protein [Anaerolineae bacterium]